MKGVDVLIKNEQILKCYKKRGVVEAGCDEAGRGCLAGPVYAAAVILPEKFDLPELNDSKLLKEKTRYSLRVLIERQALAWAVAWADNTEIDRINILNASILAMQRAIEKLSIEPAYLLIDGNRFKPYKTIPHECVIKGDGIYASIAAASILAKTYRDDYMQSLHKELDMYSWDTNKGYPTKKHRKAIAAFGMSIYHRRSFNAMTGQFELDL